MFPGRTQRIPSKHTLTSQDSTQENAECLTLPSWKPRHGALVSRLALALEATLGVHALGVLVAELRRVLVTFALVVVHGHNDLHDVAPVV